MRHALVALRAFGEAVFWGCVGGMAYWLVVSTVTSGGIAGFAVIGIPAVIGFTVGVATGAVGAVVAGLLSTTAVSNRTCRLVAGVVSGACVAGLCLLLFGHDDPTLGSWLQGPGDWWLFVVGPGLSAVAVGAWRGPAILRTQVPRLAARVEAPDRYN